MKTDLNYTELQSFSYHSGSQISVWFGDVWVNDISAISWQYSQEKRPLYGYASQHFDAVAKGQVFLQGSFTVNFRNRDYISFIMKELPKLYEDIQAESYDGSSSDTWRAIRPAISTHLRNGTFGPSTNAEILALAQSDNFWETADLYENAIWGELEKDSGMSIDTADVMQYNIKPNGFDITITYGQISDKEPRSLYDVLSSTGKTLNGVQLTGSSQVIRANGEPIQEEYSFIARDMDKSIGTPY